MLTLKIPPRDAAVPPSVADHEPEPDVLSTRFRAPAGVAWLLVEAIELAERFGCRVVEAELDGHGGGVRWSRDGRRLWVDLNDSPETRLAAIADALRGEPGLAFAEMSSALADYLAPRSAA